ncbi:MAG: hypothetical protein KDC98_23485 [Planctomycetes bacterium]|nr:hypothetical protein [Planctomycetota bacterium]
MGESLVMVGVLARVAIDQRGAVQERLASLPGVDTFEVEGRDRMGLVLEAPDLDAAHTFLTEHVDTIDGVLGTWPVSVEIDTGSEPCRSHPRAGAAR